MKSIAVMIRRKFRSDRKLLKKELRTLHRNIKKGDDIITHCVTEKDDHKGKYHSHLIIHYNDEKNLYNQLNRFIGSCTWISENSGFDEVKTNNGKWGEISLHNLYDVDGFIGYMNKYNPSETFY